MSSLKRFSIVFVHTPRQNWLIDVVWYTGFLLFFFLVEFVEVVQPVRGVLESRLINPVLSIVTQGVTQVETPFYMIRNARRSARRIQDLELRYSEALAQLGKIQALEEENQALRALLENSDRTLTDSVITRPIVSFSDPAVAVGSAEGVGPGAMVMVGQTVVGIVTDSSDHTAKVDLLYRDNKHPIVAKTESGVEGIAVGDGKRLRLTEVPRAAEVKVGERVVTTGQPGIPPDLFLGQVVEIKTEDADPVKEVIIEQLTDFYQTKVVEVVRP